MNRYLDPLFVEEYLNKYAESLIKQTVGRGSIYKRLYEEILKRDEWLVRFFKESMIMEITKKIPVPTLALQGKWDSINIGVGVIAALGNPSHICLLRNMKEKSLAVIACDGKDTMSVRVPEGFLELHKSFKIHSKQFVYETLTGWGLDPEKTYSFKGEYLEEQKMVVFCLKTMNL